MAPGSITPTTTQVPVWEPPHEDVPTRGSPMSARVESAAVPHRKLVEELGLLSHEALHDVAKLLGEPYPTERTVRLIAGIVATRVAITGHRTDAYSALHWFLGPRAAASTNSIHRLETVSWMQDPDEHLVALLPYVLDPFGPTTRRALLAGRACRDERDSRKRLGAFYTPGDVARALAREVITPETRCALDPACGAGVFLRAAFTELAATVAPSCAVECLHGIDIDATAIDACALVLTHDWLMREPPCGAELPVHRFELMRARLVHADALELFAEPVRSKPFHEPSQTVVSQLPSHFDAILTNPPFAPVNACSDRVADGFESLRAARHPTRVNMMWPFWELVSRVVTLGGRIGVVLPLSAAYLDGDTPNAARGAVFTRGAWEMQFFDRTPDALFGDDVKQRVALAFRRPGAPGLIRTTAMRRWSADRRAAALKTRANAGVSLPVQSGRVLKIGSAIERDAVERLRSLTGTLGDATSRARLAPATGLDPSRRAIAVPPTAYNWIGVFRDTTIASEARQNAAGKLVELTFSTPAMADAAYGVIVSRVFLWWWRATGDLFHMPRAALTQAPFPIHRCSTDRLDTLAAAGQKCWRLASEAPVTAVNRGVVTVAYRPATNCEALDLADRAAGEAFGLTPEFVQFIRHDADRLRTAGRSL
jgi:hypothetical protein